MKGTLIVLEGIDGSGKATQSALLESRLRKQYPKVMRISFPDYKSDSSALVKMYLRGDFGTAPEDVNPYAASLFYAADRFASYRMHWQSFYEEGGIVIADRYTTSNMVHQMIKYEDAHQQKKFLHWLEELEYDKLGLPRPDKVILLDVPPSLSEKLVKTRAKKGGSMDIHEGHADYLKKCHEAYQTLLTDYHWKRIECAKIGQLRDASDIGNEVWASVRDLLLS